MLQTSFDIDSIMYQTLVNSGVKMAIDGGIYLSNQRPVNSAAEDIVINTIAITSSSIPQTATSNVNIYVPDIDANINGVTTKIPNNVRMRELTDKVLLSIRECVTDEMIATPTNHTIIAEPATKQHYVNIRVSWNIQK